MKYLLTPGTWLLALVSAASVVACVQDQADQPDNKAIMEVINEQIANKEAIRNLYGVILNERKFVLLDNLISENYANDQGGKGVEGFKTGIDQVIEAFPDAKWEIEELIADGNKVMIRQRVNGTHEGNFQHIAPTDKTISNQGYAVYTFESGKIIYHQIMTDRLSFLQQLEILPADFSSLTNRSGDHVIFVDRFTVPRGAYAEFLKKVEYNRSYIKTLPGFIEDNMMVNESDADHVEFMTIAVWQSQKHLEAAKKSVQDEYRRINFNPAEFTKEHGITMDRQVYAAVH